MKWIATLGKDKGASLAREIIDSNFKKLPDKILLDYPDQLRKFGGLCPKLKAIILNYNIIVECPEYFHSMPQEFC